MPPCSITLILTPYSKTSVVPLQQADIAGSMFSAAHIRRSPTFFASFLPPLRRAFARHPRRDLMRPDGRAVRWSLVRGCRWQPTDGPTFRRDAANMATTAAAAPSCLPFAYLCSPCARGIKRNCRCRESKCGRMRGSRNNGTWRCHNQNSTNERPIACRLRRGIYARVTQRRNVVSSDGPSQRRSRKRREGAIDPGSYNFTCSMRRLSEEASRAWQNIFITSELQTLVVKVGNIIGRKFNHQESRICFYVCKHPIYAYKS